MSTRKEEQEIFLKNITNNKAAWGAVLMNLMLLVGCSSSVVPVSGEVTLDGKPVEKASVMLLPVSKGALPARGTTNTDGQFTLTTDKHSGGVMPGKYNVSVTCVEVSGPQADPSKPSGGVGRSGLGMQTKWIIPAKYANPKTAGISVEVKRGMDPLQIELSSR